MSKMKVKDFVEKLRIIAENYKTLYVMGGFGGPLNQSNKNYYINNYSYNAKSTRATKIKNASDDTFGFDCVCLVKGILWGWNGDTTKQWGGAVYQSNGVPDISTREMIEVCEDVSTDFTNIQVGEIVYMPGHIGVYVGNGQCIESTPIWKDGVQYSNLGNIKEYKKGNYRIWTSHGKLPYVDYTEVIKKGEIKMFTKNVEITTVNDGIEYVLRINYNDDLENSVKLSVSKPINTVTSYKSGASYWNTVMPEGRIYYYTYTKTGAIVPFMFNKITGVTDGARWYKSNGWTYPGAVTNDSIQAWYVARGTKTELNGICTINIEGTITKELLQELI